MSTAKRTSVMRTLTLEIGYCEDVSPPALTGAILEALEEKLIDEMGIVQVVAGAPEEQYRAITVYSHETETVDVEPPEKPMMGTLLPAIERPPMALPEEEQEEPNL